MEGKIKKHGEIGEKIKKYGEIGKKLRRLELIDYDGT